MHIKTLLCFITSQPVLCMCQLFVLYIAINNFFQKFSCLHYEAELWSNVALSSNLKHGDKPMICFFNAFETALSSDNTKGRNISFELDSYFLLEDFFRLNLELWTRCNQRLYCLAFHCECLMAWLTDLVFSFPVQHWDEGHLLKKEKVNFLKGWAQKKKGLVS